mmetsp:Transcript_15520/g.21423  ORF Transcript_15520/g.21423 Transcript_15520/m.21423 type:complete len:353 (+) Transcript_15520:127-1185(+)
MSKARIRSPPRGVLDGIKKDHEKQKQARLTGEDQRGHGVAWSHNFMNQKPWHPSSYRNQRLLFMAEEKTAREEQHMKEAKEEFDREQEFFRSAELLGAKDRARVTDKAALSFMYQKPPGFEAMLEKEKEDESKRQRDEAATSNTQPEEETEEKRKKVKRDMYGHAVPTAEEFPMLAGAPREASASADAKVKPFGVQIRMVKCTRCGAWGHQSVDKECPERDCLGPNEAARIAKEDPLSLMRARVELAEEGGKFQLKRVPGYSPVRGGGDPEADNQKILGEQEDEGDKSSQGAALLDQLPKKERKRLIKEYIKQERKEKKLEKREKRAAAEAFLLEAGVEHKSKKKKKSDKKS